EEIEAGTFNYTVELDGYITAEGQVTVVDQDVEVTVVLITGQYVDLPEGWSLISSYMVPDDASFEHIFADQLEDGTINILIGGAGIFWPGFNINTLGAWDNHQGYKLKMNDFDRVGIAGTMVENKTVHLPKGTSFLPVLSDVPVFAGELFIPLAEKLNFAFDLLDGLIYWPQGEIYSLEFLLPGRAYLIGLSDEGSVYYDDNFAKKIVKSESAYPSGFPQFVKTGSPHLVSIAHQAMENILEAGDLIVAFNGQDQCVGAVAYAGESNNLGLVVFGDDQTTNLKDGLNDGEEIRIRGIKSASHEFIDLDATWNTSMPNHKYFSENGLSAISELKASALSVSDSKVVTVDVYPNPAKELISFRMHNADNAIVEIYDNMGRMMLKSEINKDKNTCNVSNLSTGVYVVKIHTQQNNLLTTKLIIE
ncbi:MAG: T9SS type A sorting domain-containing protein, partial [Clostridia bacterium]|nr:T9SS type A sorting domain-containing protein [Clostridia bacterium]